MALQAAIQGAAAEIREGVLQATVHIVHGPLGSEAHRLRRAWLCGLRSSGFGPRGGTAFPAEFFRRRCLSENSPAGLTALSRSLVRLGVLSNRCIDPLCVAGRHRFLHFRLKQSLFDVVGSLWR